MAIAFDATSNSGYQNLQSTYSWNHTCTGSDLVLVVGVSLYDSNDADRPIVSITYNEVALIKIRSDDKAINDNATELWYLKNPPTGSALSIVVTFTGTVTRSVGAAISLTGVDQTNPVEANDTGATGNGSPSVNITTVADNAWIVDTIHSMQSISTKISPDDPQVERWEVNMNSIDTAGGSTKETTTADSYTMSWTDTDNDEPWAISAASFKPAGGEAIVGPFPTHFNV